ncbi:similar to Saccharomyces cerevisiae YER008C SEC3 Subunit of the exocyst complex [Maudiozyma saulgeensis]|uniref:Similar to Saccharomyces cerevisiae YER008C SEC3 Subunit of the exocyst complex n=1 Tax=Maudiozyma saulgeensis TaxID=1789683 RepID=A0A1X7R448_9SACH|nr:similar to Saccharomyces cerevisiae YER008C SEC3 Subunit of the exocyst complex [Kazachstania saulgeensis]
MMKRATSPFKKSHSRQTSTDERLAGGQHSRTFSGGSGHIRSPSTQASIGASHPPISGSNQTHKRTTSRSSNTSQNSNFLAEQYDRDRRGIINYCFSKPDHKTNSPPNNYITHVRIIEDAKYPSSRPAADSKLENKKKRVLILSAKANNQSAIQLHKARENSDGSFQIGRTWDLKELLKIERDLTIPEGFLMTMGKKYYWETNSAKERTVFIKSLVKIYMQVYDGRIPELINWDLSMFYLDERSYSRAVITRESYSQPTSPSIGTFQENSNAFESQQTSMNIQEKTSHSSSNDILIQKQRDQESQQKQVHDQELQRQKLRDQEAQRQNLQQQEQQQYDNVPETVNFQRKSEIENVSKSPSRNSLTKAPYTTSATLNRLSNTFYDEQMSSHADSDDFQTPRHDPYSSQSPIKAAPDLKYGDVPDRLSPSPTRIIGSNSKVATVHLSKEADDYVAAESQPNPRSRNRPISRSPQRNVYQERPQSTVDLYSPSNINRNSMADGDNTNSLEQSKRMANVKSLDEDYEDMEPISFNNLNKKGSEEPQTKYTTQQEITNPDSQISQKEALDLNQRKYDNAPANNEGTGGQNISNDDDLNASLNEEPLNETGDLSFENGDEIRYSQHMEPQAAHVYHEVATIQEEGQKVLPQMNDNEELSAERENTSTGLVEINDEALLETLTDINWSPEDDASRLLERIDLQLAEIEHKFNTNILALEDVGPDLKVYEDNVDMECDRMNPTFALYLMEMNTFADDIDFVESRQNGLQIESANKKLLWNTLSDLLNTVSLDEDTLKELLKCPIREKTLPWMEVQLGSLSKAVRAIRGQSTDDEYSLKDMEALKKRRQYYEKVTELFLERVVGEMGTMFAYIKSNGTTKDQLVSILQRLLTFSSLIIFCKEISNDSYKTIIEQWNENVQSAYTEMWDKIIQKQQNQYANNKNTLQGIANQPGEDKLLEQWKSFKGTRKITSDDTLYADTLSGIIDILNLIEHQCIVYQTFIDNFFHISSNESYVDFIDKFKDPSSRIIDLDKVKRMDSDRESALIKSQLVSRVFNPVVTQLISYFVETMKTTQSIAPSIMLILEQKLEYLESTDQEFLSDTFTRIVTQLKQLWSGFMEDELLYVERIATDTTTKSVFPTVLGLPIFIKNTHDSIIYTQNKISANDIAKYEVPKMVTESFNSLCVSIVRFLSDQVDENVVSGKQKSALSTDQLAHSITLLQNANWLIELLTMLNGPLKGTFDQPIQESKKIFDVEKEIYANFLLQEAIPKLTSFVNGATHVVETSPSQTTSPAMWGAYSKSNLQNILTSYNSKEISVLATKLHKRLLKHFSSGQPDILRDNLCDKLWSCLQGQTVSLYLRLYTIIDKYYKGTHVKFTKNDIITAFELFKETS